MPHVLSFSLSSRKMVSNCSHSRVLIRQTGKSALKNYHIGIFVFAF